VAVYFEAFHQRLGFQPLDPSIRLVIGVAITTVGWLTVTWLTPPTPKGKLQSFYDHIRPHPAGWRRAVNVATHDGKESITAAFLCWFLGCAVVYGALFGTGYVLYGDAGIGLVCIVAAAVAGVALFRALPRVGFA
jgi:hypothetical protein